jgi:hypothetical protein
MQRPLGDLLQPLQRQREMCAPPRTDDGVNLVDDHRTNRPENGAASLRSHEEVERFGSGHEDVWWRAQHRRALGAGRVARSNRRRDARRLQAHLLGNFPDGESRLGQVFVDVGAECLEGRHVDDAHFIGERR